MSTAKVIQFRPKEVKESIVSNKKRGFTLVYKSLKDAPFYKNLERKSLWLHLLLQAAYDECRDSFNGNVITLQRGQLLGSVQTWANDCGVGYDSARRSIEYFESEGMITTFTKKGKSGFTVVTIANFESYQDAKKQENLFQLVHIPKRIIHSQKNQQLHNQYLLGLTPLINHEHIHQLDKLS